MSLLWLSCLADYACYVPIELAHFAAVPGFAVPDPDHAGVVGDGPGERIEALPDPVSCSGDELTDVPGHRGAERCYRHHAFAETLPHHRRLESAGDHAVCGRGHERPPGEPEPGKPTLRRQLPRLHGLKADPIGPTAFRRLYYSRRRIR